VENTFFIILTTVLTIWALVGEDIRIWATDKSAGAAFDAMVWVCISVFVVEMVLSCLGKPGYFPGFFFYLDFIATMTLLLDVSYVNEWFVDLLASGQGGKSDQAESGKAARLSARAARIVRVLRLVRIVKLYKTILEQRNKAQKQKNASIDDWADEDMGDDDDGPVAESNVGKKLTDLTTRKLVLLILTMMALLPQLSPIGGFNGMYGTKYKASYLGAELVLEAFDRKERNATKDHILSYERSVLFQAYFHNWFSGLEDGSCKHGSKRCPALDEYQPKLFWVGIESENAGELTAKANASKLQLETVEDYNSNVATLARYQPSPAWSTDVMPRGARTSLGGSWNQACQGGRGRGGARLGFSLLSHADVEDYYDGKFPQKVMCPEDLRIVETEAVSPERVAPRDYQFVFVFDNRYRLHQECRLNLYQTSIVCVILIAASMVFSRDSQQLVLKPVEAMMQKVELIRNNPLIAAKLSDEAFRKEEINKAKVARKSFRPGAGRGAHIPTTREVMQGHVVAVYKKLVDEGDSSKRVPMETLILEKTIIKLGTLLALGFGSAGMNIISENLKGETAGVDAMITGKARDCIIGTIRIASFSTFTQVLQARVMTFVNQVAEIIHGVVDAYHGAPSRNNGDTFLAVWSMPDTHGRNVDDESVANIADMSVMASAMIVAGLHKSAMLAEYRTHPGLQQLMRGDCRVNITMGLHFGWAIEGSLGTEYKIDASYVSPTVSVAENVERAAEAYGTGVLVTETTYRILSSDMATNLRLIDRVKIQGSPFPMNLYTVDLRHKALEIEEPLDIKWNTHKRFRARQALEKEKNSLTGTKVAEAFERHADLKVMRQPYSEEFRQIFGMAYQNYAQGEWLCAQRLLRRALGVLGFEDGPSIALLRYMMYPHDCEPPSWWKGFHPIEDIKTPHPEQIRPRQTTRKGGARPSNNRVSNVSRYS
jgi:class 3 adenylate cyclase